MFRACAGTAAGAGASLGDYLGAVREAASIPVMAGFGIRSREQVDALRGVADGVIVGSALIECLEQDRDPAAFLRGLRAD